MTEERKKPDGGKREKDSKSQGGRDIVLSSGWFQFSSM